MIRRTLAFTAILAVGLVPAVAAQATSPLPPAHQEARGAGNGPASPPAHPVLLHPVHPAGARCR